MAHHTPPPAPEAHDLGPRQLSLLQVLRQADAELSGQELHQRLRRETARYGLATVYRNLRQLQCAGLVRCRKLPNGESVYAPVDRDDHHLTCVSCGRSEPLPICPLGGDGLGLNKVLLHGFKPLFHTFEVHGLCAACQQHEPADASP
jgi:Fur family ferric uptake transcriptional regulator